MRPPRPTARPKASWRVATGGRARTQGRGAEWIAALWLMAKGYRILGFRLASPRGEIDILAQRGRILAVVEVKRRARLDQALTALTAGQQDRLLDAGRAVARSRPSLKGLELRLDMVALAPGRIPRHVRGLGLLSGSRRGS